MNADQALVIELHQLLSEIDVARWKDEAAVALRDKLLELNRRLSQRERLAALAGTLEQKLPGPELSHDTQSRWLAFKKGLQPAYEAIASSLRAEQIHVPSLRPTNHARSAFHVAAAAFSILLIEVLPPLWLSLAALAYAGTFWVLELGRRRSPAMNAALLKFFRHVVHSHEATRVNSSTWYGTGLFLLTLTRSPVLCLVAVAILGVGDPLAGLIGRRFGRIKLVHGRSLEGTIAFFIGGAAVAFSLLRVLHPEVALGTALLLVGVASLCGALAELFSLRIDDNLSVPMAAAAGGALVLALT